MDSVDTTSKLAWLRSELNLEAGHQSSPHNIVTSIGVISRRDLSRNPRDGSEHFLELVVAGSVLTISA